MHSKQSYEQVKQKTVDKTTVVVGSLQNLSFEIESTIRKKKSEGYKITQQYHQPTRFNQHSCNIQQVYFNLYGIYTKIYHILGITKKRLNKSAKLKSYRVHSLTSVDIKLEINHKENVKISKYLATKQYTSKQHMGQRRGVKRN